MADTPEQTNHEDVTNSVGAFFEEFGFPRGAGRITAHLLICEPARQSADDIQKALNMSSGSISVNLRLLRALRIVKTSTAKGTRRQYYQVAESSWKSVCESRIVQMQQAIQMLDNVERANGKNSRTSSLRTMYVNILEAMEGIPVNKW